MKFNKSIYIALIGASAFTGCTKDFKEINTDSRAIVQGIVKPEHIFTYAIKGFAFEIFDQKHMISSYSGYYKNPAGGNAFSNRDWANPYNDFYRVYYNHLSEVVRLTDNIPNKTNMNAIARIMKSMVFQHITDLYGDVPYFEAALGLNTTILQPKYDKQEDIYAALLKEVKESTEKLAAALPDQLSYGNADLFYKNDIDKWMRFGNSLRLRMAMRIRYANPTLAAEHIKDVITKPLMTGNAHNMTLKTLDDGNTDNQSSLYTKNVTGPTNMVVSFTTTDLLKKLSDPRLPIFAKQGAMGYLGAPLQVDDDGGRYGVTNVSLMTPIFLGKVYTIVLMNAAEVNFLRAEAANANITTENAETLYNDGISLAMAQQLSLDLTAYPSTTPTNPSPATTIATNTYLALPQVKLTGSEEEKLEKIINEKWIATYYNHYEAYAEFRRTGYPRIWTGDVLGATNGEIPRRLTYPEAEFLRNEVNIKEAVGRLQGGNTLMSRIWWDVKPGLPFHHPKQGQFPPEI